MKKTIITFVFLMNFKVFLAQNQNWFIETSVFRNNYQIKDMPKFLSIHNQSDINQFKHVFSTSWDSSYREYEFENGDYLIKQNNRTIGLVKADYRQFVVGKNMVLKSTKKSVLNSSIGLNFSQLDCKIGRIIQDRFLKYDDSFTSIEIGQDSSFGIDAYHQNRRLGLNYSIDYSLRIKKFRLGLGARLGAHLPIKDKTTFIYSERVGPLYPYYFESNAARRFIEPPIIYHDDRPYTVNQQYVVKERKSTLMIDVSIYIKAEYVFFDRLGFYAIWGLTPYTHYYRKSQSTDINKINSLFGVGLNIQITN
jgi:hypothetical protein